MKPATTATPAAAAVPAPATAPVPAATPVPAPPKPKAAAPVPAQPDQAEPAWVTAARTKAAPAPAPLATPKPAVSGAEGAEQCQGAEGYVVEIEQSVVKTALDEAKKRLVKAGVVPVVEQGPKRKEPMTRVYLGEFANQQAAKKTIDKLRANDAEHFILTDKAGRLHIYAGSFSDEKAAAKEQQRFVSLGIKASLKQVQVSVPTYVLTAGCFRTGKGALDKVAELKRLGVKATVVKRALGAAPSSSLQPELIRELTEG